MAGDEWMTLPFDEAPVEIIDGDRGKNYPKMGEFSESGHCLFLNTGNVTKDGFDFSNCKFITKEKDAILRKGKLKRQDVVMTTRGTVGNVAYYDAAVPYEHMRINSGMVIFRSDTSRVNPRYLYFFLRSSTFANRVLALRTGSAQPQLPIRDINRIEVPLPPLKEQQAIACILGALDDKIELNRRMNETLETMARALFKSWFVDFDPVRAKAEGQQPPGLAPHIADLFPDAFEESELGEIPKGWEARPIGDVVKVLGGGTPRTKEPTYWKGGIHPFCTPKDMSSLLSPVLLGTERHLTDKGLAKICSGQLPEGTVLLSSRAPIGYLAVAETPVSVNQGIIAMVCDGELPNLYVLQWAYANMERIIANANGSTFLEISKRNFRPIKALVPPEHILEQFIRLADPLHQRLVSNLRQVFYLADIRDSLLPRLISGELRVPDADRIVGRAI